ncbi:MAG: NAD(P)-binding protein [Pseudomonadota bacterium]
MMKQTIAPGRALIIGSGIGGLAAGIILSKLHCRVTMVEKNLLPGGLMRGYERSGIQCPTGVHYMGALDEGQPLRRLWDYLGVTPLIPLERMGTGGIVDRYVFDDFVFDLPSGTDAFEASLRRSFPEEQLQIKRIMDDLRDASRTLSSLDMVLSPTTTALSYENFESMGQRLLRIGCSQKLYNVLAVPATLIGVPLQECSAIYYYMTLASYLMSSWRLAGSSTRMAEAFLSRFKSMDGDVITGDGVEHIRVESGQVQGVVLQSGRILEASTLIAAIHPKMVVAMLPAGAIRPFYAQRVAQLIDTKGLFGVHLAVNADTHPALPYNIYRLYPESDGSLPRGVFHQLRPSGQTGVNLLSLITASGVEEWRPWAGTRSGRRGSDYRTAKEKKARHLISEASKIFGPLTDGNILDSYTPLTIRDHVASPDGSPYGILRSAGQLMKAASLNRTFVKGLYLAGQNRLCPGIMGTVIGTFQAVMQIIGREHFAREVAGEFL